MFRAAFKPSRPLRPPPPPEFCSRMTNGRSRTGSTPPKVTQLKVPLPAALIRSGTHWEKHPINVSTIRWDVSRLPPPTAAGGWALTIVPGGATISTDRNTPELVGMLGSMRHFSVKYVAECVTERTPFTGPTRCAAVPVKSTFMSSPSMSTRTLMGRGSSLFPSSSRTSSKA